MQRPLMLWPLIIMLFFLALGGFYGGIAMLVEPSGSLLELEYALDSLPVSNYILPGIFLLMIMGLLPLFLSYALIARPRWSWADSIFRWSKPYWAWTATLILVAIIAIWLAYEGWLIGWWPITYATAVIGFFILLFALMPGVRKFYTKYVDIV